MSGWAAILIVVAATLIGVIATIAAKRDPGSILGIAIIAGTIAAAFGVRYNSAYLLVPAPTFAFVIGSIASGYVHDRAVDTGQTELAVHAAEWIGAGFLWMSGGTIVALVIALGRWLWIRRDLWLSRGGRRPAPVPAGPGGTRVSDARLRDREAARPAPGRPGFTPAPTPASAPPAPAFTPKANSGTYPRPGSPSPASRPPASDAPRGGTSRGAAAEPRRPPRPGSPPDGRYYDDETWR